MNGRPFSLRRWACGSWALALVVFWAGVAPARAETDAGPGPGRVLTDALWLKHRSLPAGARPRVALVLSGSGARGLAHIAVLKALERERVPVDAVVGVSVGAVVGALSAAGLTARSMENLPEDAGWNARERMSAPRLSRDLTREQLVSGQQLDHYLQARLKDKSFADLTTAFACVAADARTGETVVLREGSVVGAARACAAMPGLFLPADHEGRLLVDGGIVNNIPVDVARGMGADLVIGLHVSADYSVPPGTDALTFMAQALYMEDRAFVEERLGRMDFVISIAAPDISALELWRGDELMEAGRRAFESAWPDLKQLLAEKFFERALTSRKEKNQP